MPKFFGIAVLLALLALFSYAGPAGGAPPRTNTTTSVSSAHAQTWASRVRAAGLNVNASNLQAELLTLAKQRRSSLKAPAGIAAFPALVESAHSATVESMVRNPSGLGHITVVNVPHTPQPTIYRILGVWRDCRRELQYPCDWVAYGRGLVLPNGPAPRIVLDAGPCGVHEYETTEYQAGGQSKGHPDDSVTLRIWQLIVDNVTVPATVRIRVNGVDSNTVSGNFEGGSRTAPPVALIADVAPRIAWASPYLGLQEGSSFVDTPPGDRLSTDPNGAGGSGEDVLGRGISLLNHATATATITAATSYLDPASYTAPVDGNRWASVSQQPQSGSLETHVNWGYLGGESVSYTVEWKLVYPAGARPLSTLAKVSKCTDEQ